MSAENNFCRYEFLEFMVRTANFRYLEQGICKDWIVAIEKLLDEIIFPNTRYTDGEHFRKYNCYNVKTNEVLKKNEGQLIKLFASFTHSKKRWIELDEAKGFVRKVGLDVSEIMVGAMYAESMMTIVDTLSDPRRCIKMGYVEFIVFLCRISHEHY